ncbi:hypothetical protein BDV98DRAFT_557781, partial [Pterulicium gracile]
MPDGSFLASNSQKAFIGTITIQAIAVLVMVGITFQQVSNHVVFTDRYKTLSCYLALFALAELFELGMAFDALRMRNIIQLIGILVFHLGLVVFSGLQILQTHTALVTFIDCDGDTSYVRCGGQGTLWRSIQPYLIAVPIITGTAWLIIMFWIKKLYQEFGWAIFRVVGADRSMKNMFQWYQIMVCLLKFDFFCFAGVTMQLLILVLPDSSAEYALTIIAIPVVLLLLIGCGLALQREIKWLMLFSLVLMPAAMSYFLYKLIRFFDRSSRDRYETVVATLTIFTVTAFLLLFATFAVGLRCLSDFNRGLRPSKTGRSSTAPTKPSLSTNQSNMSQRHSSYNAGHTLSPRISI